MKEKILQALTTFKGYLFSSDKWLHLAAAFYYRLLRGAFRCILWPCAGLRRRRERALATISARKEPRKFGISFSVVGVLAGVLNVLLARLVFHFIV